MPKVNGTSTTRRFFLTRYLTRVSQWHTRVPPSSRNEMPSSAVPILMHRYLYQILDVQGFLRLISKLTKLDLMKLWGSAAQGMMNR